MNKQPTMTLAELADHPELFRAAKEYRTLRNKQRAILEAQERGQRLLANLQRNELALLRQVQQTLIQYRRRG